MNKLTGIFMAAIYFAKTYRIIQEYYLFQTENLFDSFYKRWEKSRLLKKVLEIEKFPTVSSFSATNNNQRDL